MYGIALLLFLLVLCVILNSFIATLQVFLDHIILFDSILIAMISGFSSMAVLDLHGAYALLLGIFVFVLLFGLQQTTIGFWVIGLIMSGLWGLFFGIVAFIFSSSDMTWTCVTLVLGFIFTLGLHLKARNQF